MSAYIAVHKTDNNRWQLETHPSRKRGLRLSFNDVDELAAELKKLDAAGYFNDMEQEE